MWNADRTKYFGARIPDALEKVELEMQAVLWRKRHKTADVIGRAAWAAVGLILVSVSGQAGVDRKNQLVDGRLLWFEKQDGLVRPLFVDLKNESSLVVDSILPRQIINASGDHSCGGALCLEAFNFRGSEFKKFPLVYFIARKDGGPSNEGVINCCPSLFTIFPSNISKKKQTASEHIAINSSKSSWNLTDIFEGKIQQDVAALVIEEQRRNGGDIAREHPSPLIFFHNVQLSPEDNPLRYANSNSYSSENGYRPSRPSRTIGRTILGVLLFFLGATFMKIFFDLLDVDRNPMRRRFLAIGACGIAAVLICQGTILILTGNWLP